MAKPVWRIRIACSREKSWLWWACTLLKLLLTARELRKLKNKVQEKGLTIIPVLLYINEKGLAKLDIALARGKHYYDKRESLKSKDSKRDIEKQLKDY